MIGVKNMDNNFSKYIESVKGCSVVRMENVRVLSSNLGISVKDAELMYLDEGIVPYRYTGNVRLIGAVGQAKLLRSKVCIIGCGGLGGTVIELCGRLGIGNIVLADGDKFEESNLNRQLLSSEDALGRYKAETGKQRIKSINSAIDVTAYNVFMDENNAKEIIGGSNIVIDALDNVRSRLLLQKECESMGVPLVHGAIGNTGLQIMTVMPGDGSLNSIYTGEIKNAEDAGPANPMVTVMMCAALEVSEAVKILLGIGDTLARKLLHYDWLDNQYSVFKL